MSGTAFLSRVTLFADLPDDQLKVISRRLRPRNFRKNEIIFHQESPGDSLYIIESGRVRIFRISEDGDEMSLTIFGRGDFFGELSLLDGLSRSAGAVTMEKTRTLILYRDEFLRCLQEDFRITANILAALSRRLRRTTLYAEGLTFLDVHGRIAQKLLDLVDDYGEETEDGIRISLRMTQSDLASLVGTSRETVNRALRTYREMGLITTAGAHITVLNPTGLRRHIY